jgi:DNA relaxase NicK
MMGSKVGPICGKLTQLVDTLQFHNINKLLQLTLHSSVRYARCTATHLQQFFCVLQKNIKSNPFVPLLYSLMLIKNGPKHVGVSGLYNLIANQMKIC